MIRLLGPLLIIGIIVAVATSARRSRQPRSSKPAPKPPDLEGVLQEWVAAGLLRTEQASAISAYEQHGLALQVGTPPDVTAPAPAAATTTTMSTTGRRIPAVAEALGYLGGILAIVGLSLAVGRSWRDMGAPGRLALSGCGALVLLIAGALVNERADPALGRLRGFLWLASTAGAGLFTGVLAVDVFDAAAGKTVAMACSAAVSVYAGLLWFWRERPLQQASCLIAVATFAGTAAAQFTDQGPGGIAVWVVGAGLFVAGLRRSTPQWILTEGVGAIALMAGAFITTSRWNGFGLIFALVTACGLLAVAVIPGPAAEMSDQLLAAVVGGVAMLNAAPSTLGYFSRDGGVITGFATWAIGAALLVAAWQRRMRLPTLFEIIGGLAMLGGAALTGTQWHGFAPLFGITTGVGLIAIGMLPERVLMSVFGSLGLLINLPWAIGRYFPGEGQAPRVILVTGALIIGVAVLLTRMSGRFRTEVGGGRSPKGGRWHRGAPPHAGVH